MRACMAALYCARQVDLLELLYRLERGRAPGLAAELGALRDEALDKFMVGMHACAWASVSRPQFPYDSHWPSILHFYRVCMHTRIHACC